MEFILALAIAATAVVSPSGVELERLADRSYDPPGLDGEFLIEVFPPVPCGDVVLFNGITFGDIRLVAYSASATGVEVVANSTIYVPSSSNTFQDVRGLACSDGRILFLGSGTPPPNRRRSVYIWTNGVIVPLIEKGTKIGDTEVHSFNELDGNALGIAMVASLLHPINSQAMVIKPFDGEPFIVADKTTVLPGQTDPATIFTEPVLVGSDLVFHARTEGNLGIYRWSADGDISIVADTLRPEPLSAATISDPSTSGSRTSTTASFSERNSRAAPASSYRAAARSSPWSCPVTPRSTARSSRPPGTPAAPARSSPSAPERPAAFSCRSS